MERHLSTGVATIVALMAAHRSAAYEKPATFGQDDVGMPDANSARAPEAQAAPSNPGSGPTNHHVA